MIRFGLPKGNVHKKSLSLAAQLCGGSIDSKKLSFIGPDVEIFFLKHRDIPALVQEHILDAGITSTEWIAEREVNIPVVCTLDWCNTRMSVIQAGNAAVPYKRCITEFPNIAQMYFQSIGAHVQIDVISGSSEAFVPALYDCCVDCVETGGTLMRNNLVEKAIIMESQMVLIARNQTEELLPFCTRVQQALTNI